jgi:hypothetical protein
MIPSPPFLLTLEVDRISDIPIFIMSSPPTIAISDEEAVTYTTPVNSGTRIWQRFSGKTRRRVGWGESAKAIICVSCKPIKMYSSTTTLL